MAEITEAQARPQRVVVRGQWLREVLAQASAEMECCRRCKALVQRAAAEGGEK